MKTPLISFKGRRIESRRHKVMVFLARVVVACGGLLFFFISLPVTMTGIRDHSWGLVAVGGLLGLGSLGLIWAGCTSRGKDVCEAAFILLISR